MSTMAINDNTFKMIERSLINIDYAGNGSKYNLMLYVEGLNWDWQGVKPGNNPNNQEYEGIKRLVGVWRANNARAYHARYMHHDDVRNTRTPTYKSAWFTYGAVTCEPLPPCQLLKSLQAISYNLDDHQCPILDKLINTLKSIIIEALPDYQEAVWG